MLFLVVIALAVTLTLSHNDERRADAQTHVGLKGARSDVPEEWWSWNRSQMYVHLKCNAVINRGRPVYSRKDWVVLRNAYRQVVGSAKSSILPNDDIDGFGNVRVFSTRSPGKGRGVFAMDNIPKGTLVWTSNHQSARFRRGSEFRKFVAAIPPEMACDILMYWAYVHDLNEKYFDTSDEDEWELAINCDLDAGSLINSGGERYGAESNIGCIAEQNETYAKEYLSPEYLNTGCPENLFALRDIKAGEEILCSYDEFGIADGFKYFGL